MTLRVVASPIAGPPLAAAAISGGAPQWFLQLPHGADGWRARAERVRGELLDGDWLARLEPAFGRSEPAFTRLSSAARSGFIVTAGQQPGLFGGPLYTWWKALSALALADELQELTGLPVAPVFWAATDDSDFAEASSTVVAGDGGAARISLPPRDTDGIPLAHVPLGDVSEQLALLEGSIGVSIAPDAMEAVRRAYSPEHTVGGAYVQLLRELFGPYGVSVLDAAHPAVREAGHPILVAALERAAKIEERLQARDSELRGAGYHVQVKSVGGRSLVFADMEGKRERIRIRDAERALKASPGTLGPNVLLRPLMEKAILPSAVYMGGPAEIAYFAQVGAVAEELAVDLPAIAPRWSGFVIEPRVAGILDSHGLAVEDFHDPHAVETGMARAAIPEEVAAEIASLRNTVADSVGRMSGAGAEDLVPRGVLEGLQWNVLHRVDRLERRFAAAIKRRGNDALRDATTARASLYPLGVPQERALNVIPLMARHGEELIRQVMESVRIHAAGLR